MHDTSKAQVLAETLDDLLQRMAGLARDQKEANRLLIQARFQLEAILDASPQAGKYAHHKAIWQAIRQYLEEDAGHPQTPDEIIDGLMEAGFKRATDTEGNIKRTIAKFADKEGIAASTRALRIKDGRVGLGEWPDDRWG